jgi:hypothetical protein
MAEAQADREHRQLLAAAMALEDERRQAASKAPGTGLLLDSLVRPGQVGLGFGEGFRPAPHVGPAPKPTAGPLVGGVAVAGARKVAPGARSPAAHVAAYTQSTVPSSARSGPRVTYVDAGPRRGLLGRIIDRLRGGRA